MWQPFLYPKECDRGAFPFKKRKAEKLLLPFSHNKQRKFLKLI